MTKNNLRKPSKNTSKKTSRGGKRGKFNQLISVIFLAALLLFAICYIFSNVDNRSHQPSISTTPVKETASDKPTAKSTTQNKKKSTKKSTKNTPKESTSRSDTKLQMPNSNTTTTQAQAVSAVGSLSRMCPEQDLRPIFDYSYTSQVIEHMGYVVSYNADYKVPNWVLYELTLGETLGNLKRSDAFAVDPQVEESQMAQLKDYRNSGFDRGHMAPNADLNWDKQAQNESYYLSNMCPQTHEFNAGIWLDLENKVREWAERDSAITIVCGPILPRNAAEAKKMKSIGKGHVLVPEYFYKVILSPFGKEAQAIAFLMPHDVEKGGRKALSQYAVPVDSIEVLTGIDFFPALPDKVEKKVEAKFTLSQWFKTEKAKR